MTTTVSASYYDWKILTVRHDGSLLSYIRMQNMFPHHSTVDQWFGESTFESYRALGEQLAEEMYQKNKNLF